MSLPFSRYVRCIFHICPVLSLPVISLHLPSRRLVSLSFVSISLPCTPLVFICPFHVRLLSCHVDFLFPPLISLHFPAFPLCSPIFPAKNHCFSSVAAKRTSKNTEFFQIFGKRRQETQTSKELAGGFESWTPVLRHRHVEWNVIKLLRGTWGTPPKPYISDVGRGVGGGSILS